MNGDFELDHNSFLPLREVVYETLRKAILKEKLKPGERLMENTIAGKLGVSRTPVREAIRMLSDEGLVLLIPRRGAQVAQISKQDLDDVLEIRQSLEVLAAELACLRITEEELQELIQAEEAFQKMDVTPATMTEIAEADIAFHEAIYRASGNRRLVSILNNLREQMFRFRLEYLKRPHIMKTLIEEHAAIVEAIRTRDTKTAREICYRHIENQQEAIAGSLRK